MRMAQEIAGYSLGEADLLRRAMGKKEDRGNGCPAPAFLKGAQRAERHIEAPLANDIFDTMEKFAGLWLQQVARGRLCPDWLSYRLSQTPFSGRLPGRVHEPGSAQYGQAGCLFPGGQTPENSCCCAECECLDG